MKTGTITRVEWKWLALFSAGLILLTSFPYLVGLLMETPEHVFSGFFVAVEDGNNYLAAMLQGTAGRWLFHNPYTPEPHTAAFIYVIYLVLGKLAHVFNLSLPLTLHLARSAAIPFLLIAVYRFAAYFTPWLALRRIILFLVAAGGGLGWLWVLAGGEFAPGAMPTDLWVPDASAFLTMLTFPHLVLAQASILWLAISGLRLLHHPNRKDLLSTGFFGLLISLIHPYSLPVLIGLLVLYWIWRGWQQRLLDWKPLLYLGIAGLISVPYLVYSAALFNTDFVLNTWQEQNRVWSPHPVFYLLGFGLLCPLALIGFLRQSSVCRRCDQTFPVLWVVVIPMLLYIPSNLQRRFLDGYQVPLALLAVCGVVSLLYQVQPRWRRRAVLLLKTISTFSNILLLSGFIILLMGRPSPAFYSRTILEAVDWLATHGKMDAVVLAAYDTGNLLPTRALVRSFVGHGPQSVHPVAKMEQVRAFFSGAMSADARLALLESYHIRYIFYGPSERALGNSSPGSLLGVRLIYQQDNVQIYEVNSHGVQTCQWCTSTPDFSSWPLRVR